MSNLVCADIRQWVQQAVLSDDPTLPVEVLSEHVATCPLCQGALAALAVETLGMTASLPDSACSQSEDELAAFIEQEAEEGCCAAIRTYPHIWWHLWTCAVCAETYQITRSLLRAERLDHSADRSMPVLLIGSPLILRPVLRLQHRVLYHVLAGSIPAMGTPRGDSVSSYVLAEKETPEQHLVVSIQRQANSQWRIHATVKPAPVGWLVLMLGTARYRARFDPEGEAIIQDIPFASLTAAEGPDLDIAIEPDPESNGRENN
jgi:hypothetical protein